MKENKERKKTLFFICSTIIKERTGHRSLKKIDFDLVKPYDKVAEHKCLNETSTAKAVLVKAKDNELSLAWYRLLLSARTFFEHGTT